MFNEPCRLRIQPWRIKGINCVVSVPGAWKKPIRWNLDAAYGEIDHGYERSEGKDMSDFEPPRVRIGVDVFAEWNGPIMQCNSVETLEHELCVCHECGQWMAYISRCNCNGRKTDRLPRKADMADLQARTFSIIDATPNLDWMIFTKHPGRMEKPMLNGNLWLCAGIEDQQTLDERVPLLLNAQAGKRLLWIHAIQGPIEFSNVTHRSDWKKQWGKPALSGIDGVIVSGESGPAARPLHPDLVCSIRNQCQALGMPFYFEGWGDWVHPDQAPKGAFDKRPRVEAYQFPRPCPMSEAGPIVYRLTTKNSGRLLDDQEWNELPQRNRQ